MSGKIKNKRSHRVAELIQNIIANLLIKEVNDPRLKFVTITGVDVAPDGKHAIIFFSLLEITDENIKAALKAFQNANGFFRLHLSRLAEFRHTPQLSFRYDPSLMIGERVSKLLSDTNTDH